MSKGEDLWDEFGGYEPIPINSKKDKTNFEEHLPGGPKDVLSGNLPKYRKLTESEKKNIATERENLPPLKEGYARVVHITKNRKTPREGILDKGLDYKKYGMLSSTARAWENVNQVEYHGAGDPRFSGPGRRAYVFDIPIKDLRTHDKITENNPGLVSPHYLVGILNAYKEEKRANKEKGLIKKILSAFFIGSIFIGISLVSLNITGFVIFNTFENNFNFKGILLLVSGIMGAFLVNKIKH